jgi:hypothetical protein
MYDGTMLTITYANKLTAEVMSADMVANKATLTSMKGGYFPYTDDYYTNGPRFNMKNDSPFPLTGQYMEYIIDPKYQVSQVMFQYHLSTITGVEYTTTAGPDIKIASGSQLFNGTSANGGFRGIDRTTL